MFVLKSRLRQTIDKEVERKYQKKLNEMEKKYKEREKKITQRKNKKIQLLISEKNKIQRDANNFYTIYRQIPIRLMSVWQNIERFKNMQLQESAQQVSLAGAIEHELQMLIKFQNKKESQIQKLLGGDEE